MLAYIPYMDPMGSCLWKLVAAAFWLQEPRLIQLFDEKRQRHGFCWDSEDRRSMEVGDAGNVIQKQEFPYHNEGEGLWIQPPKEVWPRLAKYLGLFEDCFFSQFQMINLIFPLNNLHFFHPIPIVRAIRRQPRYELDFGRLRELKRGTQSGKCGHQLREWHRTGNTRGAYSWTSS